MITVSLCMIVKNEEHTLGRCLRSVQGVVDEIVVADTGSSDGTKAVAGKYGAHVYDFEWIDDFSAARNFAFSKATKDYILWLDADDVLRPEDAEKLRSLKQTLPADVDAVMMRYNTAFDAAGNVTFSYYRERMVKRARGLVWHEPVHEYIELRGRTLNADIAVTHTKTHYTPTGRNLRIYEKILASGGTLSPRGLYYYARELKDNGRFSDAAGAFLRFLDGGRGWVEDNVAACRELAACYGQLGEREKQFLALLRSFYYASPRAEACCRLGYLCKDADETEQAVFWFRTAASLPRPQGSWGFFENDSWGYVPCIELAACLDKLGRAREAEEWNEKAAVFKPEDPSVLYNRRYFAAKRGADGA